MKFIIVTGGVLSGLGKGITVSSIGVLLKSRGYKVTAIKIDPYINCDAGTMNPFQHGEVFVLDDGGEVDLDLGNYERFMDVSLTSCHNITTGKAYRAVIEKERRGDYLGKTVQIIPHVTNEVKGNILDVAKEAGADICLVELGGTVGDIESMPFLEAVRQLRREVGGESNCIFIHTTLVPVMSTVGEQKTKPTQHSVSKLREMGIIPDAIVARGTKPLEYDIKRKISLFCDVPLEAVISAPDAKSIYLVPLLLEEQGLTSYILKRFALPDENKNLTEWENFVNSIQHAKRNVQIAVVGKYTHLADSYISHIEAFHHAGAALGAKVQLSWVESEEIEKGHGLDTLNNADGILIPGGFGDRGIEGKIKAEGIAREKKIPFLGICLGFQLATIEFCRSVLCMEDANSTEFNPRTRHPVVDLLPEQKDVTNMGATMRLGAHKAVLTKGSKIVELYDGATEISERHRHRYEINPQFIEQIERDGLHYTGRSEDGRRMEVAELEGHPYFIGTQFHPEFKSRPLKPSRVHYGLVKAALAYADAHKH
jgi:CTP synthase